MSFIFRVIKILGIIFLPFIILIRGSLWIYTSYQLHPWISIIAGALMSSFVLFIYCSWLYGKLTGKIGSFNGLRRRFALTSLIVFGFALHGLMYISAKNIKNSELKSEFLALHPIIRLSVSTLLIADRSAILTDAQRQPEDYKKMGLKTNNNSLHYKQKDGYVHAVDIRTKGRGNFRNRILKFYFDTMGFRTLRHIGTADHLHVALNR